MREFRKGLMFLAPADHEQISHDYKLQAGVLAMYYDDVILYKAYRAKHEAEDSFWPCQCDRCRARDRSRWESRRRRGSVID